MENKIVLNEFELDFKNRCITDMFPFSIHETLCKSNEIEDYRFYENEKYVQWIENESWQISTKFLISKIEDKKLIIENVDTDVTILLNGTKVGKCNNYFKKYEVFLPKENLTTGTNELKFIFNSIVNNGKELTKRVGFNLPMASEDHIFRNMNPNKVSAFYRKPQFLFGWDWAPRVIGYGINCIPEIVSNDYVEKKFDVKYEIENNKVKFNIDTHHKYNKVWVNDKEIECNIIENVKLWYPNGHGVPYMYSFKIEFSDGTVKEKKVGFRTVEIRRDKDEFGISFNIYINEEKVFIKGASHIPNDSSLNNVSDEKIINEINALKDCNFNLIRVWGGGTYESDFFYDMCDKNGILVWQDFMFACAMYPGFEEFKENIAEEVLDVVNRLKNRTCLLLFCGNNEISAGWAKGNADLGWKWKRRYSESQVEYMNKHYDDIFNNTIKSIVEENSDVFYWNSTPWTGDDNLYCDTNNTTGDSHFWGVWHENMEIEEFRNHISRFVSEYGVQSFPSYELLEKYINRDQLTLYSDEMITHQKSENGNEKIDIYMTRLFGKVNANFENYCYLSQISQSIAMQMAITEHRKASYKCGGTIYWQLNDCWPCASWSTIDYSGQYKAAQYGVKKVYAPEYVEFVKQHGSLDLFYFNDRSNTDERNIEIEGKDINGNSIFKKEYLVEKGCNTNKFLEKFNFENSSVDYITVKINLDNQNLSEDIILCRDIIDINIESCEYEFHEENSEVHVKSNKLSLYTEFVTESNLDNNFFHMEANVWYKLSGISFENISKVRSVNNISNIK